MYLNTIAINVVIPSFCTQFYLNCYSHSLPILGTMLCRVNSVPSQMVQLSRLSLLLYHVNIYHVLIKVFNKNAIKVNFSEFWHMRLKEKDPRIPKTGLNFSQIKNRGGQSIWKFRKFRKIFQKFVFSRFFRKCRKFENCHHLQSNMTYNSDLKLKISRGTEETTKILTKRFFGQIWVLLILPF